MATGTSAPAGLGLRCSTATGFCSHCNRNVGTNGTVSLLLNGNRNDDNNNGENVGSRSYEFATHSDNSFSSNKVDGLQGGPADSTSDEITFDAKGRSGLAL